MYKAVNITTIFRFISTSLKIDNNWSMCRRKKFPLVSEEIKIKIQE